jgi:putative DNA primase/helicase
VTANRSDIWPLVSDVRPCPQCKKTTRCTLTEDGQRGHCFRSGETWHQAATNGHTSRFEGKLSAKSKGKKAYDTSEDALAAAGYYIDGKLTHVWEYPGSTFQVARFDLAAGGKEFRPLHSIEDQWFLGDPSGKLPLYRSNEIPAEAILYVTEGEGCADLCWSIGLPCITSAHGAASAAKSDWRILAGREICILPDHDEPGRKYATDVAKILSELNPPARVKIVKLPWLSEGDDLVEFVGHCKAHFRGHPAFTNYACSVVRRLTRHSPWIEPVIGGPILQCLADVRASHVQWLWPGRIPSGRISILAGAPGVGKSFVTCDVASRVTTGRAWPDGSSCDAGSVLLIAGEDDAGDTIRPRLDSHRANVKKVHLLTMVRRVGEGGKPHEVMFTLADVASLETALKSLPDCKLAIIDPIGSFLGGNVDSHRDNETRALLAPVAMLASKYNCAILIVAHTRKSTAEKADDTVMGSRAFTGIARSVLHLSLDKDDKTRRLLLPGKNNLSAQVDGLAFTIQGSPAAIDWEKDTIEMNADEGLAITNSGDGPGRPADERDNAADWLAKELSDLEPHLVFDLKRVSHKAGIQWRTIQRASKTLSVIFERSGFGAGSSWRLPKSHLNRQVDGPPIRATIRATIPVKNNIGTNGTNGKMNE